MNAEGNGNSLHARNSNENRAMNYMRGRMFHVDDPKMTLAYHSLLGEAEERCDRIIMVGMNLAPNTREWREAPRMFFDSAQHAMYDSIAYEYIDDFDNSLTIDPSYKGTHFTSLDEQAAHFHYDSIQPDYVDTTCQMVVCRPSPFNICFCYDGFQNLTGARRFFGI